MILSGRNIVAYLGDPMNPDTPQFTITLKPGEYVIPKPAEIGADRIEFPSAFPGYASGGIVHSNGANGLIPPQGSYSAPDYTWLVKTAEELRAAFDLPLSALPDEPVVDVPDFVGPRTLYRQEDLGHNWRELEGDAKTARPQEVDTPEEANLIGSKADILEPGGHLPVIDLDLPCHLEPSTTPGHYHLYVNKVVPWDKYVAVLKAMSEAGLVQEGFYEMTVARGESFVRPPWVAKKPGEGGSD